MSHSVNQRTPQCSALGKQKCFFSWCRITLQCLPIPMAMMGHIKLLTEHILYAKEDAVKYAGKRRGKELKKKGAGMEEYTSSSSHSTTYFLIPSYSLNPRSIFLMPGVSHTCGNGSKKYCISYINEWEQWTSPTPLLNQELKCQMNCIHCSLPTYPRYLASGTSAAHSMLTDSLSLISAFLEKKKPLPNSSVSAVGLTSYTLQAKNLSSINQDQV